MLRILFAIVLVTAPSAALAELPAPDLTAPPVRELPSVTSDANPWPLLNDRRLKFTLNPGRLLAIPDAAPAEPRDGLFDSRGQLLTDGPNSKATWNALTDLDIAAGMRLTQRTDILVGFALSARGRFTPSVPSPTPGGPSVYFLQFRREW